MLLLSVLQSSPYRRSNSIRPSRSCRWCCGSWQRGAAPSPPAAERAYQRASLISTSSAWSRSLGERRFSWNPHGAASASKGYSHRPRLVSKVECQSHPDYASCRPIPEPHNGRQKGKPSWKAIGYCGRDPDLPTGGWGLEKAFPKSSADGPSLPGSRWHTRHGTAPKLHSTQRTGLSRRWQSLLADNPLGRRRRRRVWFRQQCCGWRPRQRWVPRHGRQARAATSPPASLFLLEGPSHEPWSLIRIRIEIPPNAM